MDEDRIYSQDECIGAYKVIRILSAGGMGMVYEAAPQPGRRAELLSLGITRVVVKVARLDARRLARHARKVLVQRIDREFETLLRLTKLAHPNVVTVFDRGWEDGLPYYVMEKVDGVTLGKALAERPRMGQAINLYAQVCGAVAFLHHGRICHRDLKPSNIMVRAANGEPVLIDFGICLPPTEHTLTSAGELLGTPAYLSPEYAAHWMDPEQTRPYLAMPTDDVWALGVILYEVLTGKQPWRTLPDRRERLLREIQTAQPPHPSDVNPRAPRALGDVAMKLLEKDPDRRPGDASAVLTLLGPAAQVSDVLSPLPPRRVKKRISDSTPGSGKPGPRGKQRGHLAGRMAAGMMVVMISCGVGHVSGLIAQKDAARSQVAREDSHGASEPKTGQPEVRAAPEDKEGVTPIPPQKVKAISRGTPLPKQAYSDQKKAPCLDYETTMVGGCWREVAFAKPDGTMGGECSREFWEVKVKDGWKCYAVVPLQEPSSLDSGKGESAK